MIADIDVVDSVQCVADDFRFGVESVHAVPYWRLRRRAADDRLGRVTGETHVHDPDERANHSDGSNGDAEHLGRTTSSRTAREGSTSLHLTANCVVPASRRSGSRPAERAGLAKSYRVSGTIETKQHMGRDGGAEATANHVPYVGVCGCSMSWEASMYVG